jgi:hypothetical protein
MSLPPQGNHPMQDVIDGFGLLFNDENNTNSARTINVASGAMDDEDNNNANIETLDNDWIEENEVNMDLIRDGIVAAGTHKAYIGDISNFLQWVIREQNDWLTEYGRMELGDIFVQREGENERMYRTRKLIRFKSLLRDSFDDNIINIDAITPSKYMGYIMSLKGRGANRHLSKSSYGNKRAALFHLFRLHNRVGFTDVFRGEIGGLFKGFYRTIVQNRSIINNPTDEPINNEGKLPMSVELYKEICGWLMAYGTADGVFAYCYLIITWNLACRAQNTADIRFKDISWSTCFDAFSISFGHSKTDQLGEEAKYIRHIYANPMSKEATENETETVVCPVFAMAVYLTSCFNLQQNFDGFLFPGKLQARRFGKILAAVLAKNEAEVIRLGFTLNDIGTHSIQKGAVSYLSSLPGGPSSAATCIRAGWTMGKIKDVYMRYVTAGDQFVGRCLSLLPILRMEFGSSPPYFVTVNEQSWVDDLVKCQFPMFVSIAGLGRLTIMGLASILYHSGWVMNCLPVNHIFRVTCHCLRNGEMVRYLANSTDKYEIAVKYPWNDVHAFSGIPPHVAILQRLSQMTDDHSLLVEEFVGKVKATLQEMGVDEGRMTEEYLKNALKEFQETLLEQLGGGLPAPNQVVLPVTTGNQIENGNKYTPHLYGNSFKRVPRDWRWPRCGVADLWRQWWIGDVVRMIPPIKMLTINDVKHLDHVPLTAKELINRSGNGQNSRRDARKSLCDLRFVMEFVTRKVEEIGALEEVITVTSVDKMFAAVSYIFDNCPRDAQKRWQTVVNHLRRKEIV